MSILSLHSINIAFGGPPLLENVSLDIHKGQRICFLGRNGAGKSTFLKIIAGEVKPDSGEIITAPGVSIAYLPQEIPIGISGTVFDVVAAGIGEVGTKLAQHNHLLAANGDPEKIAKLHQYLDHHDGWTVGATIKRVLEQTGLSDIAYTDFATLSGGMRRRTLLARRLHRSRNCYYLTNRQTISISTLSPGSNRS